jgi:Xaa-Pro aminopeptidase
MDSYFTSQFFAGNRQKLRQLFTGTAPIVMTANGLLQRGGDTTYDFAQDANFWYLCGINEPDIILVMDKDQEYLIVPGRSESRETFDGAVDYNELKSISGIDQVYDSKEGWHKLTSRLKKVKHIATVASPPAYIDAYGFYTNPTRAALLNQLKSYNPELELLDLSWHLVRLRTTKQPEELRAINRAIDITIRSIKDVSRRSKLDKYDYEYELEADLTKGMRSRGATGHAFAPIVASGLKACTLHDVSNNGPITKGELIVVDTGAEFDHYAADISRTLIKGEASKRQRSVHKAVQEVQDYAMTLLKPGVLLKSYEKQVENFMGEKLRELNLIKTIDRATVREFYPHATSHHLGLNVHDVADYEHPIEAGVVITVEPGIYIKDEAIGVRIEDNVLITNSGVKLLTKKLTRELQ